jgi:hypothetical protein
VLTASTFSFQSNGQTIPRSPHLCRENDEQISCFVNTLTMPRVITTFRKIKLRRVDCGRLILLSVIAVPSIKSKGYFPVWGRDLGFALATPRAALKRKASSFTPPMAFPNRFGNW